jgi:hypothetical protein
LLLAGDAEDDFALFGEFHRIAQQIVQHLAQAGRVADDAVWQVRGIWQMTSRLRSSALRARVGGLADQVAQREGQRFEHHLAGIDLGEVEDVVDDGQQRIGR